MITVEGVDRLVVSNDAVAARLWPRLGGRVRKAYLADRDRWTELRRRSPGRVIPPPTLAAQNKVFSAWARGFKAVANRRTKAGTPKAIPPSPSQPAALPAAAVPTTSPRSKGSGALIAGGIFLAVAVAFAAGRRRA